MLNIVTIYSHPTKQSLFRTSLNSERFSAINDAHIQNTVASIEQEFASIEQEFDDQQVVLIGEHRYIGT